MSTFGLDQENQGPIHEPHKFDGIPGLIGGSCRICGNPVTASCHQIPQDSVDDKYSQLTNVWGNYEFYACNGCGSVVQDKKLHDQWHEDLRCSCTHNLTDNFCAVHGDGKY